MPVGKKKSPAKFLGAVALGLGVVQGASQIIGGISERRRLRKEGDKAKQQFKRNLGDLQGMRFENPYADIQTSFQNPYEDLTVNQQQAEFQAEQGAQARANILQGLQGAAGGSGIAGLAQTLANQQQLQTQQISADIGRQEATNQRLAAGGATNVQAMEAQAQRTVLEGEDIRQQRERQRTMDIMSLRSGQQALQRDIRQQRAQASQQIIGGVGTMAGAAFDAYSMGMFGSGSGSMGVNSTDRYFRKNSMFNDPTIEQATQNNLLTQKIREENKLNPVDILKRKVFNSKTGKFEFKKEE